MQIRKAERRKAKLRCALAGVSGSGKTKSALFLAKGLGGKTCVIDTENRSADLFADDQDLGDFEFDKIDIGAPFSPEKYISAIQAAENANYDNIIIDSLSHAWSGAGGILDMQDAKTKSSSKGNSYIAWRDVTPVHNKLVDKILQSKSHIIVTMRSKSHYDMQKDSNGKLVPVKIGLAPIQRDGIEYEFTFVLDLASPSHYASSSKDRTRLFDGKDFIITEQTGIELSDWLNSGKDALPAAAPPTPAPQGGGAPPPTAPAVILFTEEDDLEITTLLAHFSDTMKPIENIDDLKRTFEEGWRALSKYKGFDRGRSALNSFKAHYDSRKRELEEVNL